MECTAALPVTGVFAVHFISVLSEVNLITILSILS